MPDDSVTISLFSVQNVKDGVSSYNTRLFSEIDNIVNMARKLSGAARHNGAKPPTFTVSTLLIPDWKVLNNSYKNTQYLDTKAFFLEEVKEKFETAVRVLADEGITLNTQDFYTEGKLSKNEKEFLEHLAANGSNADTIKTKALLNNAGRKHLQIDSNTIIKDYQSLYNSTFGQPEREQKDAYNANQYAPNHISANNKIVYVAPTSPMLKTLHREYHRFMKENANNLEEKKPGTNAVYDNIFAPTLCEFNLTYKNIEVAKRKTYYPAVITNPEFRITKDVVTAINMSWAEPPKELVLDVSVLKAMEPLNYLDAKYDYPAFNSIVKKYTGYLTKSVMGDEDPNFYFERFLKLSDNETDLLVLQQYYQAIFSNDSEKLKNAFSKILKGQALEDALAKPESLINLQKALAKAIPDTPKGNVITQALFGRSVQQLHENPSAFEANKTYDIQLDVIDKLVEIDKQSSKYLLSREQGFLAEKLVDRLTAKYPRQELEKIGINGIVKVAKFALALESPQGFDRHTAKLLRLPEYIHSYLMNEAKWILENGNDIEIHFNYIPNRKEKLQRILDWEKLTGSRPSAITSNFKQSVKETPSISEKLTNPLIVDENIATNFNNKKTKKNP